MPCVFSALEIVFLSYKSTFYLLTLFSLLSTDFITVFILLQSRIGACLKTRLLKEGY